MIQIYGHPFAAFVWKPLIAADAGGVPFEFRMVDPDHAANQARMVELSPTSQYPALVDGDRDIIEPNAVIEYLDRFGDSPPLVPAEHDAALAARMLADVFDDYVAAPMQRIVADALRGEGEKDPRGVAHATTTLDRT